MPLIKTQNMKKLIFPLFGALAMMFASCSQDDAINEIENGELVTFSIETGEKATRAGDGNTVNTLHFQVWDKNSETLVISSIDELGAKTLQKAETVTAGKATVAFNLVKGVPYDIVFWACHDQDNCVDISKGLDNITLKNTLNANVEAYDAFFHAEKDYKVQPGKTTVYLKRPFAQINVGTTAEDWEKAGKLAVEIDKSTITITDVYEGFNARTGNVAGSTTELTYGLNSVLDDTFTVENAADGSKTTYKYLSMNYVLAQADKSSTHTFSFELNDGDQVINTVTIQNLPIQRNWRTNIIGNLLVSSEEFEIIVDPEFDGDHYPEN